MMGKNVGKIEISARMLSRAIERLYEQQKKRKSL